VRVCERGRQLKQKRLFLYIKAEHRPRWDASREGSK